MKWRQQEVAMRRDPFVFELIRLYGGDGYMAYNITLDILGEYEKFESAFETTWDYMASQTQLEVDKVKKIYGFISGKPWEKFIVKDMETHILIFCPNLKKYADEYTKKKFSHAGKNKTKTAETPPELLTQSGHCPDIVGATVQYNTLQYNTKTKDMPAKKPAGSNILAFYMDTYLSIYGEKYPASGKKDGNLLKGLLSTYGEPRLKELIKTFLSKTHKTWNDKKDVGTLKMEIEKLARNSSAAGGVQIGKFGGKIIG